jgi:DNA repair exonuclease SbcCD ATPase subunit
MEALAEADKNYKEAIAEASKNLTETLADVQKTYNEALDQIAKDTQERIDTLKEKLVELAKTLAELGAKQASINVIKNAPGYVPVVGTNDSAASVNTNTIAGINAASGFNITQNITYPTASASDISAQTMSAIKFGTATRYDYRGID